MIILNKKCSLPFHCHCHCQRRIWLSTRWKFWQMSREIISTKWHSRSLMNILNYWLQLLFKQKVLLFEVGWSWKSEIIQIKEGTCTMLSYVSAVKWACYILYDSNSLLFRCWTWSDMTQPIFKCFLYSV